MQMGNHFGEHLTVDGYGGDPALLNNESIVRSCFEEICAMTGMHMLHEPTVVLAPDNNLKDPGGWSGSVIIAESHISIHTFPKRRFVSADVYTCQNNLNQQLILDYFTKKFQLKDIESHFIRRGTQYPQRNIA